MEIFLMVLNWALPILGSVLTVILTILAKRWIEKLGLERSEKIDNMIDVYVEKGVLAAERAAGQYMTLNGHRMSGASKRANAIRVVLGELEQSGLKKVGRELITARIEAYLEDKEPGKLNGSPSST